MSGNLSRAEQILKLAAASPGIKIADAAAILGMSSQNLSQQVMKLRKEGKLKKTYGTLELADEADGGPLPASSPSPAAGDEGHAKEEGEAASQPPPISNEDMEQLKVLVREGLRFVEAYHRDGVLANVAVIGKSDGSHVMHGIGGSPDFSYAMLGAPTKKEREEPAFQTAMGGLISSMGDGEGTMAAFFNLTDLGGGDEPMLGLMCGWVDGQRIMCATAPLEEGSLVSREKWPWVDLKTKEAEKLCKEQLKALLDIRQESGDGEEEGPSMQVARLLELDSRNPEEYLRATGLVMSDPSLESVFMFDVEPTGEGRHLGLRKLDPAVRQAVARAAGIEETAPGNAAADGAPPDVGGRAAGDGGNHFRKPAADLQEAIVGMIRQACDYVEEQRRSGQHLNFMEVLRADGTTARARVNDMLDLMTGELSEGGLESFINSAAGGEGQAVVFVNMEDIGAGATPFALLSAWTPDGFAGALLCEIGGKSLLFSDNNWETISAEELGELGRRAKDTEPEPGAKVMMVDLAGQEPGIKIGEAAKKLGIPKSEAQEVFGQLVEAGLLRPARNTLELTDEARDKLDEAGKQAGREVFRELSGTDPDTLNQPLSGPIADLVEQACQQVEKERQEGARSNFVEIGMDAGETMRAGMGGGQILIMMTGRIGDQVAQLVAGLGQGRGERAVFVSMMDLQAGGTDRVLLTAFEGSQMVAAKSAPIGDQPLTWTGGAWLDVPAEELFELGQAAATRAEAE